MPKFKINTYSSFEILANGEIVRVPVTNIVSEDAVVADISKDVNVFDKISSKKTIPAKCKTLDVEIVR